MAEQVAEVREAIPLQNLREQGFGALKAVRNLGLMVC